MEDLSKLAGKINKLKSEIEEQLSKRFRAEFGQEYYVVGLKGDVCGVVEENTEFDQYNYEVGNYFRSKEEAEQKIKNRKIEMQLRDLAFKLNNGVLVDWANCNQTKYAIVYDYTLDCYSSNKKELGLRLRSFNYFKNSAVYCLNSSFLDQAKVVIGEDTLIEYFKNYQ